MIRIDGRDIRRVERQLGRFKSRAPSVISRSLNRAVSNARKNISKKVREKYHIKSKDIKATLVIRKANRSSLSAEVKSTGNKIALDRFKVTPGKTNPRTHTKTKVSVRKDTGTKELLNAFVMDMHGKKVFEREGRSRLPIKRLFGPSVPEMIKNPEIHAEIEREADEMFDKTLKHEINRILQGVGK